MLFDHNGDGIASATQWVGSDDGFLVLDRNGDGTINNGTELFGDSTASGTGTAADGFAALKDLDTNADGKVDAADAQYASLQIWRDLNQDGVSQANELMSVQQAGIVALNTASTPVTNNPSIAATGSYVKADGTTGVMADANLTENGAVSQHTAPVAVTAQAAALPTLDGLGWVRDLQEAVTLDTSGQLQTLLTQYSAATTRTEQQALLDQLLNRWAGTSGVKSSQDPHRLNNDYVKMVYVTPLSPEQIATLEMFNGQMLYNPMNLPGLAIDPNPYNNDATEIDWYGIGPNGMQLHVFGHRGTFQEPGSAVGVYVLGQPQADLLNQSYDELRDYAYAGLLFQTRLKPYVDTIGLSLVNGEFSLDYTACKRCLRSA